MVPRMLLFNAIWATATLVVAVTAGQDVTVYSEAKFVAALVDNTVQHIKLGTHLRLTAGAWPSNPVLRTTNLVVSGSGSSWTLIDFSFLSGKLTLAPGVVLKLLQLESRNARSGIGYGIDFLTASPGATVMLVESTMFSFACLPLELVVPALRTFSRPALSGIDGPPQQSPSASASQQPQPQQLLTLGGTWCRSIPAIARCYSSCVELQDVVLPVGFYNASSSSYTAGGYTLVAYDSMMVCESPVSAACGVQQGYEACVLARRQQLYDADDTWIRLAAAAANATRGGRAVGGGVGDAGGADSGGGGGLGGGRLAGAVVGAVAGAALLATLLVVAALWHRRRRREQYAAAKSPQPPPAAALSDQGCAATAGGGGDVGDGGGPVALPPALRRQSGAAPVVAVATGPPTAGGKAQAGAASGSECVRTYGEPYSQQCKEQTGEQSTVDDCAEPYMDPGAMLNVRAWLASQHAEPPPPPPEQDQAVWDRV